MFVTVFIIIEIVFHRRVFIIDLETMEVKYDKEDLVLILLCLLLSSLLPK